MNKPLLMLILFTCLSFRSAAQLAVRPFVRAMGQASVFAPPDQVKVDASVVTQGSTAQEAASRNADQVDVVLQALRLATLQAKSHAEAMASGLGGKVGAVISLEEGAAAFRLQPLGVSASAAAGTPTPVEPGLIEVQASVVLQAELN